MTTITDRVSNTNHDCTDTDDGGFPGFDLDGPLLFGNNTARQNQIGLIWEGINIPGGATINAGTVVQLTDVEFGSGDEKQMVVRGIEEKTLTIWSSGAGPGDRTQTAANVVWADSWASTATFESPDIDTEVQEVMDLDGDDIADLTIGMFDNDLGGDNIDVIDFTDDSATAGFVNVEYTAAAGGGGAVTGSKALMGVGI